MDSYRLYEDVVNRKERVQTSTSRHNTVCSVPDCYSNCHVPCGLNFTLNPDELRGCTAMSPSGGVKCSKCNHERQFHRHYNSIWDTREVTELLVNPDKKAKFENAKGAKERAKQLEDQIMETKAKLQDRIRKATNDLGDLVERYSNLSLSGSFAGQVEKAVQMLEQNLQTMREGGASQQTIEKVQQSLNSMQAKLEVLKTTKREKDNKGTMLTTAAQNLRNYFWRSG